MIISGRRSTTGALQPDLARLGRGRNGVGTSVPRGGGVGGRGRRPPVSASVTVISHQRPCIWYPLGEGDTGDQEGAHFLRCCGFPLRCPEDLPGS